MFQRSGPAGYAASRHTWPQAQATSYLPTAIDFLRAAGRAWRVHAAAKPTRVLPTSAVSRTTSPGACLVRMPCHAMPSVHFPPFACMPWQARCRLASRVRPDADSDTSACGSCSSGGYHLGRDLFQTRVPQGGAEGQEGHRSLRWWQHGGATCGRCLKAAWRLVHGDRAASRCGGRGATGVSGGACCHQRTHTQR